MAKKSRRIIINLECSVCKNRNYTSEKNADNSAIKNKGQNIKLVLNKYCSRCKKTTDHKESKA